MAKKQSPLRAVNAKKRTKKSSSKKKKSTVWIFVVFGVLIAISSVYFLSENEKKISPVSFRKTIPKGFPTIGLDVSHHQGEMDWDKLFNKTGFDSLIHFVYCKATEGNTHCDTQWKRNRRILNNLGIPNGAYHFFITKDEPKPQAEHFLKYWKKRDIDLPPVLDVETEGFSDEDLIAKMKIWLKAVETKTGMRPIIYTSLNFYETKFQNDFKDYKFWIAAYSRKPTCIDDERIIHWQFSESGKIPGTKEMVDLNVSKLEY
ncbi:MAG: GH25 family lysozyme [Bacteroidota bacterium]